MYLDLFGRQIRNTEIHWQEKKTFCEDIFPPIFAAAETAFYPESSIQNPVSTHSAPRINYYFTFGPCLIPIS